MYYDNAAENATNHITPRFWYPVSLIFENSVNGKNNPETIKEKNPNQAESKISVKPFATLDHMKIEKPRYYCHVCSDDVKLTRTQIGEHLERHGMAELASKRFLDTLRAKKNREHSRPKVHECEICAETLPDKATLDKHLESHEDQYICDVCNAGFKILIDHTYHIMEHSEDKLFRCPMCQFTTETRRLIKAHLYYKHEQFRKYKCETCGKRYSTYPDFIDHQNKHTGEKPFQCDICGIRYMFRSYLNHHLSRQHRQSEKPDEKFDCPVCHKVFNSKRAYAAHKYTVHNDKVCVCDVCGKAFTHITALKGHAKIHSEERPFKCKFCEKSFKSHSTKNDHQRIHTGQKPNECPICGKGFAQRTSMVRHWRNHSEKEAFICHGCSKAFITKETLLGHMSSCQFIKEKI